MAQVYVFLSIFEIILLLLFNGRLSKMIKVSCKFSLLIIAISTAICFCSASIITKSDTSFCNFLSFLKICHFFCFPASRAIKPTCNNLLQIFNGNGTVLNILMSRILETFWKSLQFFLNFSKIFIVLIFFQPQEPENHLPQLLDL